MKVCMWVCGIAKVGGRNLLFGPCTDNSGFSFMCIVDIFCPCCSPGI